MALRTEDVAQARQLADLINAGVAKLETLSSECSARLQDDQVRGPGINTSKENQGEASPAGEKKDIQERQQREAVLTITSAATQLAALIRPPNQVLLEVATGFALCAALRLVVEANVPEIIRALSSRRGETNGAEEHAVAVSDMARICGVDAAKLERILRLLASHHIFVECPPSPSLPQEARFANNRLSSAIDSGAALEDIFDLPLTVVSRKRKAPDDVNENTENSETGVTEEEKHRKLWATKYGAEAPGAGLAALVGLLTDESMFHATALADTLLNTSRATRASGSAARSSEVKTSALPKDATAPGDLENEDPSASPLLAPFSRARGLLDMTMFDWLALPENARRLHRFGCAMRGMGSLTPESAILKGFDFASLPPGSTIIDVGGGVGTASLPILRAYPYLRLVVQDMEEVIRNAPGFWEKHLPSAFHSGRVTFQVQDFFEAQPDLILTSDASSSGTDSPAVFLLRMVMHNWPDGHCLKILARLRSAAGAKTKLVLVDSILMRACRECRTSPEKAERDIEVAQRGEEGWRGDATVKEAPEPLLANWGVANGLAYRLDLVMLANHNAGERTLSAFASLLSQTGWKITEVHAASESWMPQIVAVPTAVPESFPYPVRFAVTESGA